MGDKISELLVGKLESKPKLKKRKVKVSKSISKSQVTQALTKEQMWNIRDDMDFLSW